MADFALTAAPILGGVDKSIGNCHLRERDDLALVSVATPLGGEAELKAKLSSGWSLETPEPTMSVASGDTRAIRTSADQLMLVFPHSAPDAVAAVSAKIGDAGYLTDQTDVWVVLELSGVDARSALERLCPLDLHPDAFAVNASGRTVMEHMGALIVRTGEDTYLLMSASSSAGSFLHAVETSCEWIAE
ncbi:MAG: sarcosine oxidase subunit gamma [Boseongicola sp.]|nr:sarcosine oxidase subunit gamma [Boseongicola sp.]MDD9977043.1 sarcosine oxidase subunit gamma [Boseongicola sp.]